MNVFYPRLLDGNLNVLRRIEPVRGSLDMELEPLSSAELELQPGDSIPERSWVAVFTAYGLAGIFRSKPQRDRYGERSTTVSLVHGATELNDYLTGKTDEDVQSAANTAIQTIFSAYHGSLWTLGTVSPTASVVYGLNNSGVLDALVDLMEQLPGYMVTFDQTVTPWTVNIVPRPSEVTAEGRLSRNIQSVEISRDDSSLCTKVYYGENNSYVQDSTAVQKYGVIEHRISDSGYTDVQLAAMAQAYLDSHKAPKLSVSISAIDLSQITGEPLDQIALGAKYRLVIPDAETEENRVIEQIVCSVRYDDFLTNSNPQITLASDPESIITFLKQQRRSGGAGRAVKQLEEKVNNQYQHWTTENEVYKESVYKILGVELNPDGTVKYVQAKDAQGNPIYDEQGNPVWETDSAGNPVPVYNEDSEGSLGGSVKQSAQSLETLYTKTGVASLPSGVTNLFSYTSNIKQTAESIQTEVTAARGTSSSLGDRMTTMTSNINQQADKISLVVTSTTHEGQTTNSINTAGIILAINGGGQGVSSTIISADKIDLQGYVTADEIFAENEEIGQYLKASNIIATGKIITADFEALNGAKIESGLTVSDGAVIGGGLIADSISVGTSSSNTPLGNVVTGFGTVTPDPTTGVVTIPYSTFQYPTAGSNNQNINFNIADMAFYQNHVGIDSATLFAYSDDPLDYADWTKDATGTLVNKYGLIKVVTNKDPNDFYFIGIDASSGTGGTASIDDITAQSITLDQTRTTVTIKATGTNVSDRTEDAVLTNTTYTDGGFTYPCVNLTLDNTVIGRISTQSTYTSGETAGKNATNVVKGTWSQGSITYTTNAPSPNANAPKTLTLTWNNGGSWTWTTVDDAGVYQKQVQVKDGTTGVLTDYIELPDTKVIVGDQTQQASWWKTTGNNAYKYVIPAFSATDYLLSDSSNQHGLATGTNNPTVIDPSEAIAHGFGICHDSIGLSKSTQTLPAGQAITIYPTAKATKDVQSATNITTAGITITAASAIVPKVSRGNWTNGSLQFTAGTTGESQLTVQIKGGAQTPNLTYTGTEITGISFDVMEDDGTTAGADTGADITAAINKTPATLQLGTFDSTNSKFVVSKASGGSINIGSSNAIQIGITALDIPVSGGTVKPTKMQWLTNEHKYKVTASGSITVGDHEFTMTGEETYKATNAINYGKEVAGTELAVSVTSQSGYNTSTATDVSIASNGYYLVKIGDKAYKKFHAPSGGSGSSDRRATYLEQITLAVPEGRTREDFVISASSIPHYENPTSIGTEPTNVEIDAWAIYQAGMNAGGGTADVVKGSWSNHNTYATCEFTTSTGIGQGQTLTLNQIPDESTADSVGKVYIRDGNTDVLTSYFKLDYSSSNQTVTLKQASSSIALIIGGTPIAQINVRGGGEEPAEQYVVTSIDPITLTASDISSSVTKYPVLHYNDPSQSTDNTVPLQINASAVYNKGLTDGSRLNIEELRTITQPLTQNTSYTFKPSDYKDVMRAITFNVNVPTLEGVESAAISKINDNESTYNSWDYDRKEELTKKYCQIEVTPVGGENYYLKIDASKVYQAGVSAGSGYSVMGTKSYGTVRASGNYTITPDSGYDAMEKATFYVDVPRIKDVEDYGTVSTPGTLSIVPSGQYGAMKKATVKFEISYSNPTITVAAYTGTKTGQDVIGAYTVSQNRYVAITAKANGKTTTKYINLSKG